MGIRSKFHRFFALISLLAAFSSLGGAWIVGQGIAWSNMIVTYSRSAGLEQGLRKTFDGKHPCHICRAITKSRSNAPSSNAVQIELKFATYTSAKIATDPFPAPAAEGLFVMVASADWSSASYPPPSPPPRFV